MYEMADPILAYDSENEEVRLVLIKYLKENGVKQSYIAKKVKLSNCSISLFITSRRTLIPSKLEMVKELVYQDFKPREACNYCDGDVGKSIINCDVGENNCKLYIENGNELILLEQDELKVQVDNIVEIKYCPMCGRDLV